MPGRRSAASKDAKKDKVRTVLHEYKAGKLRSGSKAGPKVKDRKQAIAIALNEASRLGPQRKKT